MRVLLHVGMVCVVERACAVGAATNVAVAPLGVLPGELHGTAREIAQQVEWLAEGFLGGAAKRAEGARRIHAAGCIATR